MGNRNGTPKSGSGANVEAPPPQHRRKVALIVGITGQDVSYLTEFLLHKGYEVHGLIHCSSNSNTRRANSTYVDTLEARMKLCYADLTDASSLGRCIDTICPDEIYNLAAHSHLAVSFPPHVVATVTLQLLEAVLSHVSSTRRSHIRYCQAGSTEMFGRQCERWGSCKRVPLSETSPFHPRFPCASAQCAAYWYAAYYRKAYTLFACNGILSDHESPRQGENFVTRKITRAVGRIKIGLQSELFLEDLENVEGHRNWGFAGDYVEALWLMLQQETPDDYVVATGELHTLADFLDEAFERAGLDWREHVDFDERYRAPAEVEYLKRDKSKAEKVLGWKPKVGFKEMVKMMVDEDIELAKREKVLVDTGYIDVSNSPENLVFLDEPRCKKLRRERLGRLRHTRSARLSRNTE